LHENFQTLKAEDSFEDIITKPPVRKVHWGVFCSGLVFFWISTSYLFIYRSIFWLFLFLGDFASSLSWVW